MQKLEIFFLGTGNALMNDTYNYHSNLFVGKNNQKVTNKLLIDCGSDIPHALQTAGYSHREIKNIFISHLHADHMGGLEWLGFISYFDPEMEKPNLYVAEDQLEDLKTILNISMKASADMKKYGLGVYFNIHTYSNKVPFILDDIKYTPVKTLHIDDFDFLYSYGLEIEYLGRKIFFTSDTQHNPELFMPHFESADLILHDCSTGVKHRAHPHISDLEKYPTEIKAKMKLYHYGSGQLPSIESFGFSGYCLPRTYYRI